jgi:hypothetical protein
MKGSGIPTTGIMPKAMPMLMITCQKIRETTPKAAMVPNRSLDRMLIFNPHVMKKR